MTLAAAPPVDWSLPHLSRTVRGPVHHWHVQEGGSGPNVLLLHGAGGSTHSFRALIERLTEHYHVFAPDLPGHGFTKLGAQQRSGLAPMAEDIMALCHAETFAPNVVIGHSAGAAIALQIARSHPVQQIIGINPALSHFKGVAGLLFPALAKLLAAVPFTGRLFSGTSSKPDRIKALIAGTGSVLDADGLSFYQRLVANERHVNGALAMMSQWSLSDLLLNLQNIQTPVLFITGGKDLTVSPDIAITAAQSLPNAETRCLETYGHLVHEEAPDAVFDLIQTHISVHSDAMAGQ